MQNHLDSPCSDKSSSSQTPVRDGYLHPHQQLVSTRSSNQSNNNNIPNIYNRPIEISTQNQSKHSSTNSLNLVNRQSRERLDRIENHNQQPIIIKEPIGHTLSNNARHRNQQLGQNNNNINNNSSHSINPSQSTTEMAFCGLTSKSGNSNLCGVAKGVKQTMKSMKKSFKLNLVRHQDTENSTRFPPMAHDDVPNHKMKERASNKNPINPIISNNNNNVPVIPSRTFNLSKNSQVSNSNFSSNSSHHTLTSNNVNFDSDRQRSNGSIKERENIRYEKLIVPQPNMNININNNNQRIHNNKYGHKNRNDEDSQAMIGSDGNENNYDDEHNEMTDNDHPSNMYVQLNSSVQPGQQINNNGTSLSEIRDSLPRSRNSSSGIKNQSNRSTSVNNRNDGNLQMMAINDSKNENLETSTMSEMHATSVGNSSNISSNACNNNINNNLNDSLQNNNQVKNTENVLSKMYSESTIITHSSSTSGFNTIESDQMLSRRDMFSANSSNISTNNGKNNNNNNPNNNSLHQHNKPHTYTNQSALDDLSPNNNNNNHGNNSLQFQFFQQNSTSNNPFNETNM